jgi:hypothetical protein
MDRRITVNEMSKKPGHNLIVTCNSVLPSAVAATLNIFTKIRGTSPHLVFHKMALLKSFVLLQTVQELCHF